MPVSDSDAAVGLPAAPDPAAAVGLQAAPVSAARSPAWEAEPSHGGLAIIVSDHHDEEFGFLGNDDLARHLRPLALAALIVTNETGIGAMFAHDANLGLLGKGIFKPKCKPVGVRITHHHDLDSGILARRARWRVGVIRGLLLLDFSGPVPLDFSGPFPLAAGGRPFPLTITPVAPLAVTPEAPIGIVRLLRIRIVWLLRLLLAPAP